MKIPIVNEQDEIIGYKNILDRSPEDIIRVSALWVTDKEGNILLAQRSLNKKVNPGLWGPAASGTVEEGETYELNIIKEAEEEIGLIGIYPIIGPKFRKSTSRPYFGQWFTLVINHETPLIKQDNEVEKIKWFSKEEFSKLLEEKPEIFLKDFPQYVEHFLK